MADQPASERLRTYLLQAHLQPGQRLPAERALAEEIGVSRPALREAMRRLVELGAIEARHGDGTYVKQIDLRELVSVRLRLEPLAAELAATRREPRDVERLRDLLRGLETEIDDPDGFAAVDAELHAAVAEASRNAVLIQTLGQLTELLALSRSRTSPIATVRTKTLSDLRSLVRAIERGRPVDAERAMTRHLTRLQAVLEAQTAGG